ncbi:MAG: hypothetical protein AVDCRST_MAG87-211, partial [uncultured Thermomicrobiales bacterium]
CRKIACPAVDFEPTDTLVEHRVVRQLVVVEIAVDSNVIFTGDDTVNAERLATRADRDRRARLRDGGEPTGADQPAILAFAGPTVGDDREVQRD